MPEVVSSGGGTWTYVQDSQPSDPELSETWYDTGANAGYVYDGTSWVEQTVVDHGQLGGVSAADHHVRFGNDANDALADIPNRDHGSLTGVGAADHHVRFGNDSTDSIADIPNRAHSSLSGISAGDHHAPGSNIITPSQLAYVTYTTPTDEWSGSGNLLDGATDVNASPGSAPSTVVFKFTDYITFTDFRYYGRSDNNGDGEYTMDLLDRSGNWSEVDRFPTRGASWSSWRNIGPFESDRFRLTLVTEDSDSITNGSIKEMEFRT